MARVHEEVIVIKVSKLVKDSAGDDKSILPEEFVPGIEAMAAELLNDPAAIVEVIADDDV